MASGEVTRTLQSLPSTRRSILLTLKKLGEARTEELAETVGVTVSAMRQHLNGLLRDGLVAYEELRAGPGRPKHVYHLTPAAEAYFPKYYSELANELLEYVEEADPDLLERIFERRRQRRVDQARSRLEGKGFEERVAELTRILDEDGYLAEWVAMPDGTYRIVEHNCAILCVARRYGQACVNEMDFLRTVMPDAEIRRTAHMMAGQRQCAYEVTPAAPPPRAESGAGGATGR